MRIRPPRLMAMPDLTNALAGIQCIKTVQSVACRIMKLTTSYEIKIAGTI